MLATLRVGRSLLCLGSLARTRHYATEVAISRTPNGDFEAGSSGGGDAQNSDKVLVDPNHGLWNFFRRKADEDGTIMYHSIEGVDEPVTGRSWSAAELRRKSFKDLHTLWYLVLRERNLLTTQAEELRRIGVTNRSFLPLTRKQFQCRKTMARIKYILNERRLLYEGAIKMIAQEKEAAPNSGTAADPSQAEVKKGRKSKPRVGRKSRKAAQKDQVGLFEEETTSKNIVSEVQSDGGRDVQGEAGVESKLEGVEQEGKTEAEKAVERTVDASQSRSLQDEERKEEPAAEKPDVLGGPYSAAGRVIASLFGSKNTKSRPR